MKHVSSVLPALTDVGQLDYQFTSHKRKRIGSCELVRKLRNEQQQDLAFHSRPFVLCGLPIGAPRRER